MANRSLSSNVYNSRPQSKIWAAVICALFLGLPLIAQDAAPAVLRIDQIVSTRYPNLTAYVSVEDADGAPVTTLVRGNFQVRVDAEEPIQQLRLESFLFTEQPVYYSVILSASGRMGPSLYYQKEAVLALVDQMHERDRISLYTVGAEAIPVFQRVAPHEVDPEVVRGLEVTEDVPNIIDSLTGLVMRTQHEDMADVERKVIIALSDGRDNNSRFDRDALLRRATDYSIPVYGIGVGVFGDNLEFVNAISDATGGSYQFVSSQNYEQLPNRMRRAVRQIQQGYVLRFRVAGIPADDDYHQLMVRVTHREDEITAYRNFIATRVPFPMWLRITLIILAVVLLIALFVVLWLYRRAQRRRMGISKRKCPDCRRRMKDDWEFCPFCRYLPPGKKRRRKRKQEEED